MKLYLLRHTSVALDGICYGWLDVPLRESFPKEFDRVQRLVADLSFDKVYSSPSLRCQHLASALGWDYTLEERLRELNFGRWEGFSWETIYQEEEGKRWFQDYQHTPTPEGESFDDLSLRVASFLEELASVPYEAVCLVTHAGVVRATMMWLEGCSIEGTFQREIPYGSLSELSLDKTFRIDKDR